ncbi:MAG: TonB family protein [Acidobacteriota bacterium]
MQPSYPAIALAAHASGQVSVLVIIDKEGKVMAAQVIDGHPLLQAAALKLQGHLDSARRNSKGNR